MRLVARFFWCRRCLAAALIEERSGWRVLSCATCGTSELAARAASTPPRQANLEMIMFSCWDTPVGLA